MYNYNRVSRNLKDLSQNKAIFFRIDTLHKSDIFKHICISVKVFRNILSSKSCI